MEKKTCKECGEVLCGRIDKKFCSDQCRNTHNNRRNSDVTKVMRNINNALRRNRRILQELTPTEKSRVSRGDLLQRGFDFNYFTHQYQTRKGDTYRFCYELGYLMLDEQWLLLVRRYSNA